MIDEIIIHSKEKLEDLYPELEFVISEDENVGYGKLPYYLFIGELE